MAYKKINDYTSSPNAVLDIEAEKNKDKMMSYCENCGRLLVEREGKIMHLDDGLLQQLFCDSCYNLKVERQYSHI